MSKRFYYVTTQYNGLKVYLQLIGNEYMFVTAKKRASRFYGENVARLHADHCAYVQPGIAFTIEAIR